MTDAGGDAEASVEFAEPGAGVLVLIGAFLFFALVATVLAMPSFWAELARTRSSGLSVLLANIGQGWMVTVAAVMALSCLAGVVYQLRPRADGSPR